MGTPNYPPPPGGPVIPAVSSSRNPLIHFLIDNVPPPAPLYLQQDDVLQVNTVSNFQFGSDQCFIRGRFLDTNGILKTFEQTFNPVFGNLSQVIKIPMGEGYLLSIAVFTGSSLQQEGELFVSINVARGGPGQTSIAQCLASGNPTIINPVSWPAGGIKSATNSQGAIHDVQVSNPAAGAEWSFQLTSPVRWRLLAVRFTLVTSAAVANRNVMLILDDGTFPYLELPANFLQTATSGVAYNVAPHGQLTGLINGRVYIPLPPNQLFSQFHKIRSSTALIQAADQYSAISLLVEEWQTGTR